MEWCDVAVFRFHCLTERNIAGRQARRFSAYQGNLITFTLALGRNLSPSLDSTNLSRVNRERRGGGEREGERDCSESRNTREQWASLKMEQSV